MQKSLMKKFGTPVKLPPLIAAGSIEKAGDRARIPFIIRRTMLINGRKLRSRSTQDRKNAAVALASIVRGRNCLLDSVDALRILGREARGKNLEAAQTMVEELGRGAYQESLRCTARSNELLCHATTLSLAAISGISILYGPPLLTILAISLTAASAFASLSSLTKEGSPINLLKMSSRNAWKILENTNK